MIICGIKLTHDGAIALIDNQKLIFSYEMEKLGNADRYMHFNIGIGEVERILQAHGYSFDKLDRLVLDGWTPAEKISVNLGKGDFPVKLAGYGSMVTRGNVMDRECFSMPGFGELTYASYQHVAGHIAAAYCSSPFAKRRQDAYVLVWDGGMFPQLFYFHHQTGSVENLGILFTMLGSVYAIFAQHFDPYKVGKDIIEDSLSVPGKVMAYIALGKLQPRLLDVFKQVYKAGNERSVMLNNEFAVIFAREAMKSCYSNEDILCTFHFFLERLLVDKLAGKIKKHPAKENNLCFTGGSALNIKWNSAIRGAGLFKDVWVPPYPNDAGNAIGTACCEMMSLQQDTQLQWSVYSGPGIIENGCSSGWKACDASLKDLAGLLYSENEPVVFLNGAAELGPRALGNRSILAAATHPDMKQLLNRIKGRENYRPVAPICLEEDAAGIFDPGTWDPYMLFDHTVRNEWKERIPAVCHLDGTARLQTVSKTDNPVVYELLTEYKKISGIPLLCNTSANYKGKGFFPDTLSAMEWNETNYVWSANRLYERKEKLSFPLLSHTFNIDI